ncbi:serine hydrolase domain-containing protein [Mucilaginibacter auburnensis]|uniref:CubicO group peptidase (Beta-lactamase class C family) n=1 Tax=Mucilaginibacter auburnensis TaxID=1457233 RepID=A0A2H9VMQ8_9SPHI|nr:serine hydrolase domain-containing protein [Mucilaginibacter auburnensis]PJJ79617.1 CubicO group peptidase (beta-lactamase class C family) [Mucilaginibacter auburnensis]
MGKKWILTLFIVAVVSIKLAAQNRQLQKTDSVLTLVKQNFALKNANGIYALTGDKFRAALSPVAFQQVCVQQLFPLGSIKTSTLISFQNNSLATYKLQFEAVTLQLLLSLDQFDKIEVFLFQPYKDNSIKKIDHAATDNKLATLADKKVDTAAREYIQKANTVGLSIGIIKDGVLNIYNYGETAKGNKKLPTGNTIFEIGSITKTFTATLLAWYVNEGKAKLTDPITKYLPDSVAANPQLKNITLQTLSNHTSGLPRLPENYGSQTPYDRENPYKNYTKQLLYSYLKRCRLNTDPGKTYAYSNLGVGLLGIVLEKISGKPYERMAQEVICTPLQMKNTAQHLSRIQNDRFTTVYDDNGEMTAAWDFDALAACGALRSSVSDLATYVKANMVKGQGKLSKAFDLTHQITYTSTDTKIGLGWHIIKIGGVDYTFHNGGTYGSSSFMAFNKEKNLAVIVLANAAESTDALGAELIKKLQ